MIKAFFFTSLLAATAIGQQISWTQKWSGGGSPWNGYHDIHYDPFSKAVYVYSTAITPDSNQLFIYSSKLHYYAASDGYTVDHPISDNGQAPNAGCYNGSDSNYTFPPTQHPVGQIWLDNIRHRLWLVTGVCSTVRRTELWYYQLTNPRDGHKNWVQVTKGPTGVPMSHFPSMLSQDSRLKTTLSQALDASSTNMYLTAPERFANGDYVRLRSGEVVRIVAGGGRHGCQATDPGCSAPGAPPGTNPLTVERGLWGTPVTSATLASGTSAQALVGMFDNATIVHDTDHDAFILMGNDNGSDTHAMQVYCDTSANPTPGTLTPAQRSVGCVNPDDFTDITSRSRAGNLAVAGAASIPAGMYYPNIAYDPINHKVVKFAGLYGAYRQMNEVWTYDPVLRLTSGGKADTSGFGFWTPLAPYPSATATFHSVPINGGNPVFDAANGDNQALVLTQNVTGSTFVNGVAGRTYTFRFCQPSSGVYNLTRPANTVLLGADTFPNYNDSANSCTQESYLFDGAKLIAYAPGNSSEGSENGRVAFAYGNGKYYYHKTPHANGKQGIRFPAEDWVYDIAGGKWTQLPVAAATPLLTETLAWDSVNNQLITFAGDTPGGVYTADGISTIWVGSLPATSNAAPSITSSSPITSGAEGSPYTYVFTAAGSMPMTWSMASGSLPSGLSLSSTGTLSGTPSAAGTFTFSVKAANSVGTSAAQSFLLTINSAPVATAPSITTAAVPPGVQSIPFTFTFTASGTTPITWTAVSGSLPPGLSLSSAGVLSGTPTTAGNYVFSIQAANSVGTDSATGLSVSIVPSSPSPGTLNIPITVQEAIYPGSVPGVSRSGDGFCQGIPLADSAAITDTSRLSLTGATAGQFRILGRWPSGNAKWVEVCGIVSSLTAGGTATVTLTNGGSGDFGGTSLATDNGATIRVSTGAATFTVRKARFNVIDSAVVGGKTVVASNSSQGMVLTGPDPTAAYPKNVTCGAGTCTTLYSSINDSNSTCVIEKNGPVEAMLKCTGDHVDATGHVYMHFTVRERFRKGKTDVKVTSSLRNADYGTSNTFATAYKGHQGYELRLTPNVGGTLNYSFGNHTTAPSTGTLSGTDSVYLYQGSSQSLKWQEPCNAGAGCVTYTQDKGYSIVKNGTPVLTGTDAEYPQGWADISDGNGTGIEIGVYQLSAYWPKSLEFNNGGQDVRIGIWARQNSQPYYQEWPQHSTYDLYLNFHAAPLASPANDFLAFQHYLVARAPYTHYNSTRVFPYTLIDAATEDAYYKDAGTTAIPNTISASRACCGKDFGTSDGQWPLSIFRYYFWGTGGGGNQTEFRWSYLMNFITRGWTGRYLQASHFYRFQADSVFPRSDGFNWRDRPHVNQSNPELDGFGMPVATSANSALATGHANWLDQEHGHWYGMPDYYFMTGDESVKDAILDGPKDRYMNLDTYLAGNYGGLWNTRAVGVELMSAARLSTFLSAIGDPDGAKVIEQASSDYMAQVNSELCVSGYPAGCSFGPVSPEGSWKTQGISRTRGVHYGGTYSYATPWCQDDNLHVRGAAVFMANNLIQGILELRDAVGPSWSEYLNSLDLAYGLSRWALTEMYVDDGSGRWDINGYRYYIALDVAGNCKASTGVQDSHTLPQAQQTVSFAFLPKYLVDGDVSWANKFKINIQRDQASIGTITSDFNSNVVQHMINIMQNPTKTVLNAVPITTFKDNGGGNYTISWTVPTGAHDYRIKWGPKQIVEWIGFDPINNAFTGDPVNTMAWFAANNVPTLPTPTAAGTTQSITISTGLTGLKVANFSVKAYVGSSGGPTAGRCDLNGDGVINSADLQTAVGQSLGTSVCGTADLNGDLKCDVVDIERIIIAAMGGTCRVGP